MLRRKITLKMVAVGGLEPPRLSADDFESSKSTNSITPPYFVSYLTYCNHATQIVKLCTTLQAILALTIL